jgi:hypothetical protein
MSLVDTVINHDTCNRLQCRSAGDGGALAHFLTGRSAGRRRSPNNNVGPRGDKTRSPYRDLNPFEA